MSQDSIMDVLSRRRVRDLIVVSLFLELYAAHGGAPVDVNNVQSLQVALFCSPTA
jgi:hypothetical protein